MWAFPLISGTLSALPTRLLNLTSFISNLFCLIPQLCSGKYDIRDLPSDLIEEVVTYFMNSAATVSNLEVADSNTILRNDHESSPIPKEEGNAFQTIDEAGTAHLSYISASQTLDVRKPAESKSLFVRILDYLVLSYYRYEVTFGIYVLGFTEKVIFNSIVMGVLSAFIFALYLAIPFSWLSGFVSGMGGMFGLGKSSAIFGCGTAEARNFSRMTFNFAAC